MLWCHGIADVAFIDFLLNFVHHRFDYEIFDIFSTSVVEGGWLEEVNSTKYASDRARPSEPITILGEIHVKMQFLFIAILLHYTAHTHMHAKAFALLHRTVGGQ